MVVVLIGMGVGVGLGAGVLIYILEDSGHVDRESSTSLRN